jgi:hypothetical protein
MRKLWVVLSTGTASVVLFAGGCSVDDAIVGGHCIEGYTPCGQTCCIADGSPSDGTMGDGFPGDVTADGYLADADTGTTADGGDATVGDGSDGQAESDAIVEAAVDGGCPPGLSDCSGICVDLNSSNTNCGLCGFVCPPGQTCFQGICGTLVGHFILFGSDFATGSTAQQSKMLQLAVNLAPSQFILTYAVDALPAAVNEVETKILKGPYVFTTTTATLPQDFSVQSYGALLVYDQPNPSTPMATLGTNWASQIQTFVNGGGIVIVLDGGTGTGTMPDFVNALQLLPCVACTAHTPISSTFLALTDKSDPLASVFSPFQVSANTVSFTTAARVPNFVNYVATILQDSGGVGAPVVIDEIF